jgi:DNA helicase-2/ATP-dependent DNA helicase PcrA
MPRDGTRIIEGRAVALDPGPVFESGARIFHDKFGPGNIVSVDGPRLTVEFDKAGRKMVQDAFVSLLSQARSGRI